MYVDTPEGQVHFRVAGSGEPLLLLHRAGLSSDEYTEIIPFLSKRYLVLATDHMGHGNSDLPPNPYRIEDYARNTVNFLDAMNIKQAHVLGGHFSSVVALEMAVSHPARVNKLILFDLQYPSPELQKERLALYINKIMKIKEDGSHLMDLWQDRRERGYKDLGMCQRDVVDHLRPALGTRAEDGHIALHRYDFGSKLSAIKSPTLLLYSPLAFHLKRLELAGSQIHDYQARMIDGAGFTPTWEKPREFAQAVLEFLDGPKR